MPEGGSLKISSSDRGVARSGEHRLRQRERRGGADSRPCSGRVRTNHHRRYWLGMDQVTLAKATEPFFTTKGPGKGTGLGLSMVQGLAAQSGGLLRIHSEPNTGTVVEFGCREPAPRPRRMVRAPESSAPLRPATAPCTVLIVDDDTLVMTGTAAMILDLGHTAIEAHSGAEALKLSGRHQGGCGVDRPCDAGDDRIAARRIHPQEISGIADHPGDRLRRIAGRSFTLGIARLAKPCTQHEIATAIHRPCERTPWRIEWRCREPAT